MTSTSQEPKQPSKSCVDCFRALADRTRLKVLAALQERPQTVSELQKAIGVSQPTISHHVKLLVESGVVTGESHGRETSYKYKNDHACTGCGVFSHPIKV